MLNTDPIFVAFNEEALEKGAANGIMHEMHTWIEEYMDGHERQQRLQAFYDRAHGHLDTEDGWMPSEYFDEFFNLGEKLEVHNLREMGPEGMAKIHEALAKLFEKKAEMNGGNATKLDNKIRPNAGL